MLGVARPWSFQRGPRCQAFLDASVAPPSGACSDNKCKHECTHKTNIWGSLGILVPLTVSTPTPSSNTKRDVIALWELSVVPVLTHQVFGVEATFSRILSWLTSAEADMTPTLVEAEKTCLRTSGYATPARGSRQFATRKPQNEKVFFHTFFLIASDWNLKWWNCLPTWRFHNLFSFFALLGNGYLISFTLPEKKEQESLVWSYVKNMGRVQTFKEALMT